MQSDVCFAGLTLALLSTGCQVVMGYEDFSAANGAAGLGSVAPCQGLSPPELLGTPTVATPRPDGSCFFMDEHEVTQGQYAEFVSAGPQGLALPCAWNNSYVDATCLEQSERVTQQEDHPQSCVDQCDAEEYCRSVGKTLCRSSYAGVSARDDWGAACTNAGQTSLPYGKSGDGETCNLLNAGLGTTSTVGTNTACENDVGARDLVGNLAEWTGGDDACSSSSGSDDKCLIRGGSFADSYQVASCDSSANPNRSDVFDYVGFRCCFYDDE